MLDPVEALLDSGFHHVVVLDGTECGLDAEQSLILALWCYEAEKQPASDGAWIHPYYFASQKAYTAASSLVKSGAFPGLALRDEIRVKPIFARLPDFSQGTNTISYIRGIGSRFHVQILTYTPRLPATAHLLSENKPLHCGECRKCVEACPTNALEGGVFHRERCIRNWMMVGGEDGKPADWLRCVPASVSAQSAAAGRGASCRAVGGFAASAKGNGACAAPAHRREPDAAKPGIIAKLPACRLQRRYVADSAADAAIAPPVARRQHTRGVGTLAAAGGYFFFERIVIE